MKKNSKLENILLTIFRVLHVCGQGTAAKCCSYKKRGGFQDVN